MSAVARTTVRPLFRQGQVFPRPPKQQPKTAKSFSPGHTYLLQGGSTTGGTLFFILSGGSSTSAADLISYNLLLTGGSSTSGTGVWNFNITLLGGSSTSGTLTVDSVAALADLATYLLSLDTLRTYEFTNYDFTGFARFQDVLIACDDDGIYDLETTATTDNNTAIAATLTFVTDFGFTNWEQIRGLYHESTGPLKITITDEDGNTSIITSLTAEKWASIPKNFKSHWFKITCENISGEQVEFRRLHGRVHIFERGGF